MIEWGSDQAIISEINENDPIPFISNISGDTCPPNYNHQITIYGQNFRPESTVNIPGVSNLVTTVISPTEIIAQFTSGTIIGAFDVEVLNDGKSSLLWGQNNKLNIITATGGTLPLLDTWIDCRVNGSPDALMGSILKDSFSTWNRGIFGYSLVNCPIENAWHKYYLHFASYSFPTTAPIQLEMIFYCASVSSNIRWGLLLPRASDNAPASVQGLVAIVNMATQFVATTSRPTCYFQVIKYEGPAFPLDSYTKISFCIKKGFVRFCRLNSELKEVEELKIFYFSPEIISEEINAQSQLLVPGVVFNPVSNSIFSQHHLTAFKLSWA